MTDIRDYKGEKNWKYTELSEQSGREARAYFLWYKEQIKKRTDYLRAYLLEKKVNFSLDYSEDSLYNLWVWYRGCKAFVRQKINEAKQIKEEHSEKQWDENHLKELVGILDAIEMDIAIYFAETMIHNHPQLRWDYLKKRPRMYAYHQPVIMGFDDSDWCMLPWLIIQNCSAVEDNQGIDKSIRDIYKIWERSIE